MIKEPMYDGSLEGLFALLGEACRTGSPPGRVHRAVLGPSGGEGAFQPDLFGAPPESAPAGPESSAGCLPPAEELRRLSAEAYEVFLQGWMSELPVEAELVRFAWKVLGAGRKGAERVLADRGDPDTRIALEAAEKVRCEVHRLLGFLRFSPGGRGFYIARCAPDHFVLPALGPHFTRRFGRIPWAIIDEKRDLSLIRRPGEEPELAAGLSPGLRYPSGIRNPPDSWEDLWRLYHRSANIENRKNPALQRQFMPLRYWKYLPELAGGQD